MAKLLDTLMNRVIKGKLVTEDGDVIGKEQIESAVAEVVNEMIPEIEPSLKASAIEFDTNKDDYTQAELREIISHQVLYLVNENKYFYKVEKEIPNESVANYMHHEIYDDANNSWYIVSLQFGVDLIDGEIVVSMPDLFEYSFDSIMVSYFSQKPARLGVIPPMSESTYDFGTISASTPVDFTGKQQYTKTTLKGTIDTDGYLKISLPSFVKCIVCCDETLSGGDSYTDSVQKLVKIGDLGDYVEANSSNGWILSITITDYIAYVMLYDNN